MSIFQKVLGMIINNSATQRVVGNFPQHSARNSICTKLLEHTFTVLNNYYYVLEYVSDTESRDFQQFHTIKCQMAKSSQFSWTSQRFTLTSLHGTCIVNHCAS